MEGCTRSRGPGEDSTRPADTRPEQQHTSNTLIPAASEHVPDPLTLQHHHDPTSRKGVVSRKKITPSVERCRKQSGPASKGQLPS
ncbi:hypothetical protein VIGAN_06090900, partial [Vigna angularis var. angularis]